MEETHRLGGKWYDTQCEIEIFKIIGKLENDSAILLKKFEYDLQEQTINIEIAVPRRILKLIKKKRSSIEGRSAILLLRRLVLDIVASNLFAKTMEVTLTARAFLVRSEVLYKGKIHNSDFSYARLD